MVFIVDTGNVHGVGGGSDTDKNALMMVMDVGGVVWLVMVIVDGVGGGCCQEYGDTQNPSFHCANKGAQTVYKIFCYLFWCRKMR